MNRRERRARARAEAETPKGETREETFVEKQVRLVLEQQCRAIADKLTGMVPAGVGFALFLMDYGKKGNVAYVATVDREDMVHLVQNWLNRFGEPAMRQAIREVDAGRVALTPELEKEADRDAKLAEELFNVLVGKFLVAFSREYPDAGWEVIAPALLRAAALHTMVGAGMSVEDFAVLAEAVARQFEDEAASVRAAAERVMAGGGRSQQGEPS